MTEAKQKTFLIEFTNIKIFIGQ